MINVDVSIEKAVLGAFMLEYTKCGEAIDSVRPVWFSEINHQKICTAIQVMRMENKMIDLLTVAQELKGDVDAYTIADITNSVSSASNVVFHVRVLQQLWTSRELNNICLGIAQRDDDPFQRITELQDAIDALKITQDFKITNLIQLIDEKKEQLEMRRKSEVKTVGRPSGCYALDKYIGGIVPGDLIIVAGRPGMGKTAFAVSLGLEHCRFDGCATMMFSIEMPEQQIADRVISGVSDINNTKIRNAELSDYDMAVINNIALPSTFYINDNSRLSIDGISAAIKSARAKYGITLVIIDYLQLIKSETKGRNREQEVSYISQTCKRIAKDSGVCVMALAQLSREVDKREGKTPQLSDLRESGSIEQDADVVLFPVRPDYYMMNQEGFEPKEIEEAHLHIGKNRNGGTGYTKIQFKPSTTQYIFK